ncbi:MAG: acyltransferase family protein [Flavobacteriales bacterium]
MKTDIYLPQLTTLRFFLALLIVIFHCGQHTFPFNTEWLSPLISEGAIAVSCFFFLSGLVLYYSNPSIEKFSAQNFFLRRFARIYPLYFFAFVLTLISAMLLKNAVPKASSILLQMFGLHAWVPGICLEINYPSWSLSVEIFFYLLFPFLFLAARKLHFKYFAFCAITLWIASTINDFFLADLLRDNNTNEAGDFLLYFPLWHLNTFVLGMLCGWTIKKYKDKVSSEIVPVLVFIAASALLIFILSGDNPIHSKGHNGLFAPLFFIVAFALAVDKSFIAKILGRKELVFLGEISYSMYLLQFPVYLWFCEILQTENVNGNLFFLYLAVLLICSAASYIFIEKKCRKLLLRQWR